MDIQRITAKRVDIGLSKARMFDLEQLRRKRKGRHRHPPPVITKMDVRFRPSLGPRMPTLGNNAVFSLRLPKLTDGGLRKSDLKNLEIRPPRHLRQVRTTLSKEIKAIGKELAALEEEYYGQGNSLSDELSKMVILIKSVMSAVRVGDINSVGRVGEILKQVNVAENRAKFKPEMPNIIVLKDYCNKVKEYIPDKMTRILERCWKSFDVLDKYCVSFHDPEAVVTLDTVDHYKEQIQTWKEIISRNLENILAMSRQFRNDGVLLNNMSDNVKVIGSRFHCVAVPFLLMFPEACANIRNTSFAMTSWIEADENYTTFIRNDVLALQNRREEKMRAMRDAREKFHSVTYKLSQAESDYAKLAFEVEKLKEKEEAMIEDEEFLSTQTSEMELEIEVKDYRRDELRKLAVETNSNAYTDTWDALTAEVRYLRERLPIMNRQLMHVRHKLVWIQERRKALEHAGREEDKIRKEVKDFETEKLRKEKAYSENETRLDMARKVHMYKTSPGAMDKLFYKMSLDVSRSTVSCDGHHGPNDTLSRTCDVVADVIEHDWPKLYRNLPFYPLRGQMTVEQDIREISVEANRLSLTVHASRALVRWRRFHTRVRLDDIMSCLKRIRRADVIEAVDRELNPPVIPEEKEEDDSNLPVGPELVPFYRQVERYDKIRAAKKSKI